MMPESRISELIDGRRHHQVVEQDRELVLERVPFLGQVLAGELAEPRAPLAVELEPDGRLEPLVDVGADLRQVLAGHVLAGDRGCRGCRVSVRPGATFSSRMIASVGLGVGRVAAADAGWGCTRSGTRRSTSARGA